MRRNLGISIFLVTIFSLAAGMPAYAQCAAGITTPNTLETTPTADMIIDNVNNTVVHTKTGLMWKQCAEGQSGSGCASGSATLMNWANALAAANGAVFAGYSDWRLPNLKELFSISELCGASPAINQMAFPATPGSYPSAGFWSSSTRISLPSHANFVHVTDGIPGYNTKVSNYYVRLVRGGQVADAQDRLSFLAAALPDTGQTLCDSGSNILVACTNANAGNGAAFPRQDGRFGRDAKAATGTLTKTGGGAAGFDYTKLGAAGNVLAIQNQGWSLDGANHDQGSEGAGTNWSCVRDNVTKLTWEIKTSSAVPGLRDLNSVYTWYNSTGFNDAGVPGIVGDTSSCTGSNCDTQSYAVAVNATTLCGYTDWRMPTYRELLTLVNKGASNPSIETNFFPNTIATPFWTASSAASVPANAWYVDFAGGLTGNIDKSIIFSVRLVRGGQF